MSSGPAHAFLATGASRELSEWFPGPWKVWETLTRAAD